MKILTTLLFMLTLVSCFDGGPKSVTTEVKKQDSLEKISAPEIANALSIHRVVIQIPKDGKGGLYGFSAKHQN